MNKEDIIEFFDKMAPIWDADSVRDDEIISLILDEAEACEGKSVLDVACGTGFLFNDYYKRNVKSLTGIDISDEMINICSEKFYETHLICADAEEYEFKDKYDVIVIHNAFPHFCNAYKLFSNLSSCLNINGRITVSHDMSRQELNSYHSKRTIGVSALLPEADELAAVMAEFLYVDKIIDNDRMYLVSGIKK